eukprot:172824-Hanusia_phi.AAC.1
MRGMSLALLTLTLSTHSSHSVLTLTHSELTLKLLLTQAVLRDDDVPLRVRLPVFWCPSAALQRRG